MKLQKIYNASPIILQNLFCTLYGIKIYLQRYQRRYRYLFEEVIESQYWDKDKIDEYQNRKFIEIVNHAYFNIRYYRQKYDKFGVNIHQIKDLRDVKKLPLMSKEDMRLVSQEVARGRNTLKYVNLQTSGSTGTPLLVRVDYEALNMYYALWKRYKLQFGITNRSRKLVFGGKMVVPLKQQVPPFWRMNYFSNQLYFSTHHLSKKNIPSIVEKMIAFDPEEIFSYPSALYLIAKYNKNIKIPSLKIINTTSENLFKYQRDLIEKVFNCQVRQTYGMVEPAVFFEECNLGKLHHNFEFGFYEVLDKKGNDAIEGEIIVTGFYNKVMPFIRYKSNDNVVKSIKLCPCGKKSSYLKCIDGRKEDYIITPEGNIVGRMSHIFKGEKLDVVESQFIQRKIDELEIYIVPSNKYSKDAEKFILRNLKERLGTEMKFKIKYVDKISRDQSGKLRTVISKLDKNSIDQESV